jgi:hypothetical protein
MVKSRSSARLLLLSILWVWCYVESAAGQSSAPSVKVAALVPIDYPEYEYVVGEPFKLNIDYSVLSDVDLKRLRVRLFRGTLASLGNLTGRMKGNCASYYGALYKPIHYNGGVEFGINFDEHWLRPKGSLLTEEHYVVVFEVEGPAGPWLDLDRNFVIPYFKSGVPFVVRPDGSVRGEEAASIISSLHEGGVKIVSERLARRATSKQAQGDNTANACWSLQIVNRAENLVLPRERIACGSLAASERNWFSRRFRF